MDTVAILSTTVIGAFSTYFVNRKWQLGAVKSSALLSFIVALFFKITPGLVNPYLTQTLPFVFIGASFIGMVSTRLVARYWIVMVSGFVFGIIYLNLGKHFVGFGGLLGLSASISILAVLGMNFTANKIIKAFRVIRIKKRDTV